MLEEIYNKFSTLLSSIGTVYVAGGAVRDTLLGLQPKDSDIFVCVSDTPPIGFPAFYAGPWFEQAAFEILDKENVYIEEPEFDWQSSRFCKIEVKYKDCKVQIMFIEGIKTVDDLLDTFDWNVSLFAYDGQFYKRMELDKIGKNQELILQKSTFPLSTLRRGFRFSERFGMALPNETIYKIILQMFEYKLIGLNE
jgi:hypothetical protein